MSDIDSEDPDIIYVFESIDDLKELQDYVDKRLITYSEVIIDIIESADNGNIKEILDKVDAIYGTQSEDEYRILLDIANNMNIEISLYLENKLRTITLSEYWNFTPYTLHSRSKYRIVYDENVNKPIFNYMDINDNFKLNLMLYLIYSYETLLKRINSHENLDDVIERIDPDNMTCEFCMRKIYYPECVFQIPMEDENPYGLFCRYACAYYFADRERMPESSKKMLRHLFDLDYEIRTPNVIPGAVYDNFFDEMPLQ